MGLRIWIIVKGFTQFRVWFRGNINRSKIECQPLWQYPRGTESICKVWGKMSRWNPKWGWKFQGFINLSKAVVTYTPTPYLYFYSTSRTFVHCPLNWTSSSTGSCFIFLSITQSSLHYEQPYRQQFDGYSTHQSWCTMDDELFVLY